MILLMSPLVWLIPEFSGIKKVGASEFVIRMVVTRVNDHHDDNATIDRSE